MCAHFHRLVCVSNYQFMGESRLEESRRLAGHLVQSPQNWDTILFMDQIIVESAAVGLGEAPAAILGIPLQGDDDRTHWCRYGASSGEE